MHAKLSFAATLAGITTLAGLLPAATAQQTGFTLYEPEGLGVDLGTGCISALTARIECHRLVRGWDMPSYHPSLGDVALTDEVCSSTCQASLQSWFNTVSSACAGKALDGTVATRLGGYMWAGFNETCVRDPRTRQYCNDIIANFTTVPDYTQMPQTELCHTCNIRKLAFMQASSYSIYDAFYKVELEYVYSKCGVSGPTEIPPPLTVDTGTPTTPYCVTGKRYTTVAGDTCESISNKTSVSSAALYMGNQDSLIKDCSNIPAGVSVCLPITCQTYLVRPSDTCEAIEVAFNLELGKLRHYNSWLEWDCRNLQPATDVYGKVICVSPQGGQYTGTPLPNAPVPTGVRDGYVEPAIAPPTGVEVAEGTTRSCGKWHVVAEDGTDTCTTVCVRAGLTIALFRLVNPSIASGSGDDCTASLQPGTALCVGPTYQWNVTVPVTTQTGSLLGTTVVPTFTASSGSAGTTSTTMV